MEAVSPSQIPAVFQPAVPSHRIKALDGLRGIAILMVLAVHLEDSFLPRSTYAWKQTANVFINGWAGVDLFFVLSGFLITGILLETRPAQNRARSFYGRRMLRIFPIYYLAILLIFIGAHMLLGRGEAGEWAAYFMPTTFGWLSYLVYLQNWWMPFAEPLHSLLGHLWSLAVEEQFYFLWPLFVWIIPEKRLKSVCGIGFLLAIVYRWALIHYEGHHGIAYELTLNDRWSSVTVFARMDSLLAGAFCCLLVRDQALLKRLRPLLPVFFALAMGAIFYIDLIRGELWTHGYYTRLFEFSLLAIIFSCLVLWTYLQNSTGTLLDRILRSPILTTFGIYSYGIYIYHNAINQGAYLYCHDQPWFKQGTGHSIALALIVTALSLIVAVISYHAYEVQFLRLKDHFKPKFAVSPGVEAERRGEIPVR